MVNETRQAGATYEEASRFFSAFLSSRLSLVDVRASVRRFGSKESIVHKELNEAKPSLVDDDRCLFDFWDF